MDVPIPSPKPERLDEVSKKVLLWVLSLIVLIPVLAGIFWILFYSVGLANSRYIIPLRNWYQDVYWQAEALFSAKQAGYPPFDPVYKIQPQVALASGTNTYTFIGSFSAIDPATDLLYVKSSDAKIYVFRINNFIYDDIYLWVKPYVAKNIHDLATFTDPNQVTNPTPEQLKSVFTDSLQVYIENKIPIRPFKTLGIRWNDTRNLGQIESDYLKDPTVPINDKSIDSTVLVEFQ